jgi:ADP-ribose pyrophosphatase YjhB (NUDIX family)
MTERPVLAVSGVVLDRGAGSSEPRVLLIKRARPPSAGRWSLPGGRVEPGERLLDALARELHEEAGIWVRVGPLVMVVEVIEPPFHYVILDYMCELTGGDLRAGDDASEAALVPASELAAYGVTDLVADVVTKALAMEPLA